MPEPTTSPRDRLAAVEARCEALAGEAASLRAALRFRTWLLSGATAAAFLFALAVRPDVRRLASDFAAVRTAFVQFLGDEPGTLQARGFVVKGPDGQTRALLGRAGPAADPNSPFGLALYADGKERAQLTLLGGGDGYLSFKDGSERERLSLAGTGDALTLSDGKGHPRVQLSLFDDGAPNTTFYADDFRPGSQLGVHAGKDGVTYFDVFDRAGKDHAFIGKDGAPLR
jgi:hypothetical protein